MIFNGKSVEFDVPRHADIEQTKYLYDYDTVSLWDLFLEKLENLQELLNNVKSTVVIKGTMIKTRESSNTCVQTTISKIIELYNSPVYNNLFFQNY